MLEHTACFVADMAQVRRHIPPVAQGVAQGSIGHGRHNGVRIRIAVSGHINFVHPLASHRCFFYYKTGTRLFQYEDILKIGTMDN